MRKLPLLFATCSLLTISAMAQEANTEKPAEPIEAAKPETESQAETTTTIVGEPVPFVANYGANYYYPYYAYAPSYSYVAYTPGFIYPAYSYTPISPIAYPVYGYYPYYYGIAASPYYSVGYGYGYVPYPTYGGYYTWYPSYPGVGWYAAYGSPIYMGW